MAGVKSRINVPLTGPGNELGAGVEWGAAMTMGQTHAAWNKSQEDQERKDMHRVTWPVTHSMITGL